jgi:hypothetical protein
LAIDSFVAAGYAAIMPTRRRQAKRALFNAL